MKQNLINSLYLHFPFCQKRCNYCDFFTLVPESAESFKIFEDQLMDSAQKLNKLLLEYDYEWEQLESLYIGGGTPSFWGERGVSVLENILNKYKIGLSKTCEATLEINPGNWTKQSIEKWVELGVNRFSIGVQAMDNELLSSLDRLHNVEEIRKTLSYFKENNFNFSVDLMLGLPFSGARNIAKELEELLAYGPKHFSVYILTAKSNYIHGHSLPCEENIEKEYLEVSNIIQKCGYEHYEVSNFALPEFKSRHNLKYWNSESVAALGPSATGYLKEAQVRFKWKNYSSDFTKENLNIDAVKLEKLYMALRTSAGIDFEIFFNKAQLENAKKIFESWDARQLGKLDKISSRFCLNSRGYLIMDNLIDDLFSIKAL